MSLIDELRWRGMFHDAMPGTAEHLEQAKPVTGYIGFDPTAASLHIGNLATIMLLVHLQRYGHRPVALIGGATGMIGDPSGKSAERNLLDEATLRANQDGQRAQLEKLLRFDDSPTGALMVNNYDWFRGISFLDFLRDVGKHLTVNYMMAKDSVKRRLQADDESEGGRAEGISFTEFSYQLLQGYDFYHLYKEQGVTLQMGASDQWGNITTGTELIRRLTDGEGKAYALVGKLITKSDGTKYGKSESGAIWLDPAMTSPYQFYQFFLRTDDADVSRMIRVFTLLPQEEIEALEAEHAAAPHLRVLQRRLAEDVTTRVHSKAECDAAIAASEVLFGGGELASLSESMLLDVFAGVPQVTVTRAALELPAAQLLSDETGGQVFPSRGEARKMIQGGGVSVNRQKLATADQPLTAELLHGKYLVVQKGKKQYYMLAVVDR